MVTLMLMLVLMLMPRWFGGVAIVRLHAGLSLGWTPLCRDVLCIPCTAPCTVYRAVPFHRVAYVTSVLDRDLMVMVFGLI